MNNKKVFNVFAIIFIIVMTTAVVKTEYDWPLFLTAVSASITGVILYEAFLKSYIEIE